jgi:hypothetical protein
MPSRLYRRPAAWLRRRNPITLAVLVALAVSGIAIAGVLDEQKDGRSRDAALAAALAQIQNSRKEGIRVNCAFDRRQNEVTLAILAFSYKRARQEGRLDPDAVARIDELTDPIEPEALKAICRELVRRIDVQPPPVQD